MIVLPPNIQGPFSSTSCISSSILNLKSIKPFVVVMTFSNPLFFHTLNAIVFTTWYDILKPGKDPTMHPFHFPIVSSRISSGMTSLAPINCLGMPFNKNLVLESMTRTLSGQEVKGVRLVFWCYRVGWRLCVSCRGVFEWWLCYLQKKKWNNRN